MSSVYTLIAPILVTALIGFLVYSQNSKSPINRVYALLTIIVIALAVSNVLSLEPSSIQSFYVKSVMAVTSLGIFMLYALAKLMSSSDSKLGNTSIFKDPVLYITVPVAAIAYSDILFSSVRLGNPPTPVANWGIFIFAAHFIVCCYLLVLYLRRGLKADSKKARDQARVLLWGIVPILTLAPITGFVMLLVFDQNQYVILTPFYGLFFVACVGYAIVRHGLFDIKLAAVRSLAYTLSLTSMAAVYFGLAYVTSLVFFQESTTSGVSFSPPNVALALLLAFIFQPIKRFFDRVTDSIFFRDRYDSDDFIARLNETLASTLDLRNLLVRASTEIGSTMKAEHAFLYVRYNHTHKVMAGTKRYSALPTKDVEYLNRYVLERDGDVIVAELLPERHQVRRILNSHKTAILMALTRKGKVIGYLGLGEQRSSGYTDRDVRVLKTIADGLVIAIQNALSVQEVKDVNAHLEQRIDAATAELRTSNERLKKLDATKDEFISMASHQLRTPLTSIKGYISMVLEGDTGKVNPQTTKLLEEAFISSERMVGLIHDFLNVSRIQTGKFMLEKEPLDLVKIVDEEVNSLVLTAQSRGLELQLSTKLKKLVVELDQTKMRQVIMNFIDNALYYSPSEKKVTVTLATRGDRIEFRVKDEGIGVPKKEQAELFKKFYRASNARIRRPDGTGVGLFLAKKVIASHNGGVIFESTEGKGSTFGFWLPMPADDKVKTSRK